MDEPRKLLTRCEDCKGEGTRWIHCDDFHFHDKESCFRDDPLGCCDGTGQDPEKVAALEALLAAARQQEREQACLDVCWRCRRAAEGTGPAATSPDRDREWVHQRSPSFAYPCAGSAIRGRAAMAESEPVLAALRARGEGEKP